MGSYVDVKGLMVYYETAGEGHPVLLLHGGGVTSDSWYGQISPLSEHYRVLAPERRGHGRTADVEGPVTPEIMADDMAAFLEALGTGPVHVVGWSDGGSVALHLALRRPDLVSKLVVMEAGISWGGETGINHDLIFSEDTTELAAMFRPQHENISPDGPEHFPVVFAKWLQMWRTPPSLDLADLARITAPTLVLQADDGGVRLAHTAEMVRALPDAQLAIVPGTSHALPMEKPELVNRILLDFFAEEQTPKFMPLGALKA